MKFSKQTPQSEVVTAVAKRGYFKDKDGREYSMDILALRQALKLIEETSEMLQDMVGRTYWAEGVKNSAELARMLFDENDVSEDILLRPKAALDELADVQVVIFCLAHALGEPDIAARAVEKATADVKRGVR